MKRPNSNKSVLTSDANSKQPTQRPRSKKKNEKVVSLVTNCSVCNKVITKQHYHDGFYFCNKCKDLTPEDIYIKIADMIDFAILDDPILYLDKEELMYLLKDEELDKF